MSNKTRLDVLLTEQGLQESRQKAQATIMSGLVFVNGQRVDKPGTAVPNDAKLEIRGNTLKPPPAALRTVCCKMEPARSTRWM